MRQVSKSISGEWNQNTPNIFGRMQVPRVMSVPLSITRKRYKGSWRLGSDLIMTRIRKFPNRAMMYMAQKRMLIQNYTDSRPGIPISVSTKDVKTVPLSWSLFA